MNSTAQLLPSDDAMVLKSNERKRGFSMKEFVGRLRQHLSEMSINRKVGGVIGAFVALLLLTIGTATLGMSDIYARYNLFAELTKATEKSIDLRSAMGEVRYHAVRYVLIQEDGSADSIDERVGYARSQLAKIRDVVQTRQPELIGMVSSIDDYIVIYGRTFDALEASMSTDPNSPANATLAQDLARSGDAVYDKARAFENELQDRRSQYEEWAMGRFFTLVYWVSGLTMLALLVLIGGIRYLSRDVGRKLGEITSALNVLATGDRDVTIEGHDRSDEIGDMVRAVMVFRDANEQLACDAEANEARLLAEREREQDDQRAAARRDRDQRRMLIDLAERFDQTVGDISSGVAAASAQLKTTAGDMAATAERSSGQSDIVARFIGEASSGVTAAAAASDEFAMSIGEISRQAASSAELARDAAGSAKQADTTISELSISANEVGKITDLIQAIAKRTNLLALNASIEAARGGEAGRGFAVVASEVKELALQTSRATEEIAGKIRTMETSTGNSVNALRNVNRQIEQLEATAIAIASAVDQQSVAGQELARSIDLAARSADAVTANAADMHNASLATGTAASQVLSSASDLERQSSTLHEQMGNFLRHVRKIEAA